MRKTARDLEKNVERRFTFLKFTAVSTFLIPKAGINVGGIPFTANLLLIGLLITYSFFSDRYRQWVHHPLLLSLIIPWFLLCLFRSNVLIEEKILRFGSIYWFLLVPLFWMSVDGLVKKGSSISSHLVIFCSFVTTLFGLGQFLFGLNFLKISGVTIAWGDSYERKNLNIFDANTVIGNKIPSTFQGGNIWGQCSAVILVWVIVFQVWREFESRILKIATVISPIVSVFLSFSRTAIVASIISVFLFFFSSLKRRGTILLGFVFFFLFVYFFASQLSNGRYSLQSFTDSAGRTFQWSNGISHYSLVDWFFGRSSIIPNSSFHMEGILGLFGQVGLVGFFLILLTWIRVFKGRFLWTGLPILICLCLDSTYLTPPLLLFPGFLYLVTSSGARKSELALD